MTSPVHPTIRILLFSQHPIVCWGLERLIQSRGPFMTLVATVTTCDDIRQACRATCPDILLLELDSPFPVSLIRDLVAMSGARVLGLVRAAEREVLDELVLAGASGVLRQTEPVDVILKAIERVHDGEIWVDRKAAGRIFAELARRQVAGEPTPEQHKVARLTRRERQTLEEVGRDASASSQEIASRLNISEHTLRNHLTAVYAKLEVANRVELYAFAQQHLRDLN